MNGSTERRINRRIFLRVVLIIGVGFGLTAIAIRLLEQEVSTLDRAAADTFLTAFESMFSEDTEALVDATFSPDFMGHLPLMPRVNADGWKEYFAILRQGLPNMRIAVYDTIFAGDRLVVRMNAHGNHLGELYGVAPQGRFVSVPAVAIFRFNRSGQVMESWFHLDTLDLLLKIDPRSVPGVPDDQLPGDAEESSPQVIPSNLGAFQQG